MATQAWAAIISHKMWLRFQLWLIRESTQFSYAWAGVPTALMRWFS